MHKLHWLAQEEPKNAGAWLYAKTRLRNICKLLKRKEDIHAKIAMITCLTSHFLAKFVKIGNLKWIKF